MIKRPPNWFYEEPQPPICIDTSGDDFQIGHQHAEHTRHDEAASIFHLFKRFPSDIRNQVAPQNTVANWVFNHACNLCDCYLLAKLRHNMPEFAIQRLQGLADGMNWDVDQVINAILVPDQLQILQAGLQKLKGQNYLLPAMYGTFGCSSFVNNHSQSGLWVGRNLDFPGGGYWDRHQVLQMIRRKDCYDYLALTTVGCPFAGISGVNEKKIYVGIHQHYAKSFSLKGTLPFLISEQVLAEADNLSRAVEVIKQWPTASAWAFILADGKTGEACIVETAAPDVRAVRWLNQAQKNDYLVHTNFYLSQTLKNIEFTNSARMNADNLGRYMRLEHLMKKFSGDPQHAIQIISDQYDESIQSDSLAHRTISAAHNIQSFVIHLSSMTLYLGAETAPIHSGCYFQYDLAKFFEHSEVQIEKKWEPYKVGDHAFKEAKYWFVRSFWAYLEQDLELAISFMQKSVSCYKSFVNLAVLGVLYLKTFDFKQALSFLLKARDLDPVIRRPEQLENLLYLARTYQWMNQPQEAAKYFEEILNQTSVNDPYIRSLAEKKKSWTRRQLRYVFPPYGMYVPID